MATPQTQYFEKSSTFADSAKQFHQLPCLLNNFSIMARFQKFLFVEIFHVKTICLEFVLSHKSSLLSTISERNHKGF